MGIDAALKYLSDNKEKFLEDLKALMRIKSISSLDEHRADIHRCAEALRSKLEEIGFEDTAFLNKDKNEPPVILASWKGATGKPTAMVYGHYDVVDADSSEQWNTDPFQPVVKDGFIYGRGATDDKGQLLASLLAAEAILKTDGKLPINLNLLYEGEEEVDSACLEKALNDKNIARKLACDAVFISDGSWIEERTPSLTSGVRGICEFEIRLTGPKAELHSGVYGGTVGNPVNVLAEMLGKLWDGSQKVLLPDFYDDVVVMTDDERKEIAKLPFNESDYRKMAGVKELRGDEDFTPYERVMARPAMDIVGIWGGYSGEGPKSAIPTSAGAKVSLRLVADQDSKKIAESVQKFLNKICPKAVQMELKFFTVSDPCLVRQGEPMLDLGRTVMKEVFGKMPVLARTGGSIPIMPLFHKVLNAPVVMCDLALPDNKEHSANENYPLEHFYKGIEMYIRLFYSLNSSPVVPPR